MATKPPPKDEGPVKFSDSPAYHMKPEETFYTDTSYKLWFEPHVMLACMSAFFLYFFVLREENDIDEKLGGLDPATEARRAEIKQLVTQLQVAEQQGLVDSVSENRLRELYFAQKKSQRL